MEIKPPTKIRVTEYDTKGRMGKDGLYTVY